MFQQYWNCEVRGLQLNGSLIFLLVKPMTNISTVCLIFLTSDCRTISLSIVKISPIVLFISYLVQTSFFSIPLNLIYGKEKTKKLQVFKEKNKKIVKERGSYIDQPHIDVGSSYMHSRAR